MTSTATAPRWPLDAPALHQLAASDVARALAEDIGSGDLTAAWIDPQLRLDAWILARESATVCGQAWVNAALRALDPEVQIDWQCAEGDVCGANSVVLRMHGRAQALLSAERSALNFLQLLSAVATHTARYVAAVAAVPGAHARIVDTRKTIPGLRLAQKYAVAIGGGLNHRIGLYDAVLIKENHIAAVGGVRAALARAQSVAAHAQFIQIEVETLAQLEDALSCGARMVLLDNMSLTTLRDAVRINAGRAVLEISGGVQLERIAELAATGVDRISIGSLTKDIRAIDYSMRFAAFI